MTELMELLGVLCIIAGLALLVHPAIPLLVGGVLLVVLGNVVNHGDAA